MSTGTPGGLINPALMAKPGHSPGGNQVAGTRLSTHYTLSLGCRVKSIKCIALLMLF